jgi:hypothetical protein
MPRVSRLCSCSRMAPSALDVDLSVPGLIAGVFGGGAWMRQLGRQMGKKGGSARTQSKARAARENGKRGGRPRKTATETRED